MGKKEWKQTSVSMGMIFSFGFVLGCICINLLWRIQDTLFENDWAFTLEYYFSCVEKLPYFPKTKTVLWIMAFCGGVFLLGFYKYGKVLLQGLVLCVGFLTGGIETIWLLNFNLKEGLFFLGILVIKCVFGLAMIAFIILLGIMMSTAKDRQNLDKRYVKKYVFLGLIVPIISLVYIIFMSYVNL